MEFATLLSKRTEENSAPVSSAPVKTLSANAEFRIAARVKSIWLQSLRLKEQPWNSASEAWRFCRAASSKFTSLQRDRKKIAPVSTAL